MRQPNYAKELLNWRNQRLNAIKVHPSGTIAWLSAFEDATWTLEGQPDEVTGMRITWVLEKIEGKWVIVEGHWSVPEEEE